MQQTYWGLSAEVPKITHLAWPWLFHGEESQMDWSVYAPLPELQCSMLRLVQLLESPLLVLRTIVQGATMGIYFLYTAYHNKDQKLFESDFLFT